MDAQPKPQQSEGPEPPAETNVLDVILAYAGQPQPDGAASPESFLAQQILPESGALARLEHRVKMCQDVMRGYVESYAKIQGNFAEDSKKVSMLLLDHFRPKFSEARVRLMKEDLAAKTARAEELRAKRKRKYRVMAKLIGAVQQLQNCTNSSTLQALKTEIKTRVAVQKAAQTGLQQLFDETTAYTKSVNGHIKTSTRGYVKIFEKKLMIRPKVVVRFVNEVPPSRKAGRVLEALRASAKQRHKGSGGEQEDYLRFEQEWDSEVITKFSLLGEPFVFDGVIHPNDSLDTAVSFQKMFDDATRGYSSTFLLFGCSRREQGGVVMGTRARPGFLPEGVDGLFRAVPGGESLKVTCGWLAVSSSGSTLDLFRACSTDSQDLIPPTRAVALSRASLSDDDQHRVEVIREGQMSSLLKVGTGIKAQLQACGVDVAHSILTLEVERASDVDVSKAEICLCVVGDTARPSPKKLPASRTAEKRALLLQSCVLKTIMNLQRLLAHPDQGKLPAALVRSDAFLKLLVKRGILGNNAARRLQIILLAEADPTAHPETARTLSIGRQFGAAAAVVAPSPNIRMQKNAMANILMHQMKHAKLVEAKLKEIEELFADPAASADMSRDIEAGAC